MTGRWLSTSPKWGLAWANRHAPEDVLLRNAMLQGRFHAVLEAAVVDGLPFVRRQLESLRTTAEIGDRQAAEVERMIASIERGLADAAA